MKRRHSSPPASGRHASPPASVPAHPFASTYPFDSAPEEPAATGDLHERVAEHAYAIWEQCGRPSGQALDHWLRAEREIEQESAHVKGLLTSAAAAMTPPHGR